MMMFRIWLCLSLLIGGGAGVVGFSSPLSAAGTEAVIFATDEVTIDAGTARHLFRVEMAKTPKQRARGLMFRRSLKADEGMLFIYESERRLAMWMKNTFIPLDMLFIGRDGTIVSIEENTMPHSLTIISSELPAFSVLEVQAGTVRRLVLKVGNRVHHPVFLP